MTYIGQQPATTFDAGIQDRFTGLSSNTVTLTHEISAEEDILVVWNNIVQDKNTYSVGGAGNKTLTLGGTLVSADVVTVYYLNKVMQSVNPTAGSVNTTQLADLGISTAKLQANAITGAKLNTDVISAQTALGATPADTDELLVSDAGVLKRVDYSHLKVSNSKLFYAYLNSNQDTLQNNTYVKVNFGHELFDVDSVYDTSSYKYIPASTGYYYLNAAVKIRQQHTYMREVGIAIYKNGSMIMREEFMFGTSDILGNNFSMTVNGIHNSTSTSDYFEVYAFYNTGSAANNYRATGEQEMTYFSGYKLIT